MRSTFQTIALIAATTAAALATLSCNMTGGIDSPKSRDEILADAQAKLDTGDCAGAVSDITPLAQDNHSLQMLGTAYLCQGGATTNRILGALGAYSPSSTNLTVIGDLANRMVPVATDAVAYVNTANQVFNQMTNGDFKSLWQVYGNVALIAALEAKAAGANAATVTRANLGTGGCAAFSSSCGTATVGGGCGGVGMSAADATTASNALAAAVTAANSTSLASISNLIQTLNNLAGSANPATGPMICVLFNNTLSN